MRVILVFLILVSVVVGCSDIRTNKHIRADSARTEPNNSSSDTQENLPKKLPAASVKIDFLDIAENAQESWFGSLQGVQVSDSSGPYVFKQFVSDSLSFEIVFYPKQFKKSQIDFQHFDNNKKDNYSNFICFTFVYPMRNVGIESPDYHKDNTPYPVAVKGYVLRSESWILVSSCVAKNLTELSECQIRTMYANRNSP